MLLCVQCSADVFKTKKKKKKYKVYEQVYRPIKFYQLQKQQHQKWFYFYFMLIVFHPFWATHTTRTHTKWLKCFFNGYSSHQVYTFMPYGADEKTLTQIHTPKSPTNMENILLKFFVQMMCIESMDIWFATSAFFKNCMRFTPAQTCRQKANRKNDQNKKKTNEWTKSRNIFTKHI